MRSFSRSLLLGCVLALLAPLAASAEDYTPSIKQALYTPLDSTDGSVTTLSFTGSAIVVDLPFAVTYYGSLFQQLNISSYGYVTFALGRIENDGPGGWADPTVASNEHPLPNASSPNGVIAAWWDDLVCPAGTIKTRTVEANGDEPGTFTVEWNGCYASGDPKATVQMQLRLTDGEDGPMPFIRVYYGSAGPASNHSATVGIENPPRWVGRELETSGGTLGVSPVLAPACSAGTGCTRSSWPTDLVIQYGQPLIPDLVAGSNPITGIPGLQVDALARDSSEGPVTITLLNRIENLGRTAADNVTRDYYLSTDAILDPAADTRLDCGPASGITIGPKQVIAVSDSCTVSILRGIHRICTYVDPPTFENPRGAVDEADELNNTYCSDTFVVGVDLIGSIAIGKTAVSGGALASTVTVENRGTDGASGVEVQVWLRACGASDGSGDVLAWKGIIDVAGRVTWNADVDLPVGQDLTENSICAVLVVNPGGVVREEDVTNNDYNTCREDAQSCAAVSLPELWVRGISAQPMYGCFFGEPIVLEAEICNDSQIDTRNFALGLFVDTNTTVSYSDTEVVSVPQSCYADADCIDLDGRAPAPTCVQGICENRCIEDNDCGNSSSGLRCESSLDGDHKTCQLVLRGGECKTVRATVDVPISDRWDKPFSDGNYFFSAIVDWTSAVLERDEGSSNTLATAEKTVCRTRKPDFEAIELRTVSSMAPGEVFPVLRRVRNNGVVEGVYSYRYVLSVDGIISTYDIGLSIEGKGLVGRSGELVGRGEEQITDMVRVPSGILPGVYYLGIVIDPDDEVVELSETNNTVASGPVTVIDSLRILTTSLPNTTVRGGYDIQLLAAGGTGGLKWMLATGSDPMPSGLKLETSGRIHGAALEAGTYLFRTRVESAGNSAERLLALEVVPASGPLAITLAELVPAFTGANYRVILSASGGVPPYLWECDGRPGWLDLNNGVLSGMAPAVVGSSTITCTVNDDNKTRDSRSYTLAVHEAGEFRIRNSLLDHGTVGEELAGCVHAEGGSGSYLWSVDQTTVPSGIGFGTENNAGCFSGVPTSCGSWPVDITVTDMESGLTAARLLPLTIDCDSPRLVAQDLPDAKRGEEYPAVQLQTDATGAVTFELAQGELPAGLSLTSDGIIAGKVSIDARSGGYGFAVRVRNTTGGSGVGAMVIVVPLESEDRPKIIKTTSGCSASGEGSAMGLLSFTALLAVLGLRRRSSIRPAAAGLAAASLLLPAIASAQFTPVYATYHRAKVYQELPSNARDLTPTQSDQALPIDLVDWSVPFYGESFQRFSAHENGLLLFGSTNLAQTPYAIPNDNPSSLRSFIAGWWANHNMIVGASNPTRWRWMVRGSAPNREVVVEWKWLPNGGGAEHQISIWEDGTIAIRWGNYASGSNLASIGLMDRHASGYSIPFLGCSSYAGCNESHWNDELRNTEAVFTPIPNLQIRSTWTSLQVDSGFQQQFQATMYNHGSNPATAPIRFYASTDKTLSDDDVAIATTAPVELGAFEERVVEFTATVPWELDAGRYYLLAIADPDDLQLEFLENDNVGGDFEFVVREPRTDITASRIGAPSSGARGSTIELEIAVKNLRNVAVKNFPFAIVLSGNEAISVSDRVLYEGTISLDRFEAAEATIPVLLPVDVPAGSYRIGLILDPGGSVDEIDKLNNVAIAERPLVITGGGLAILTSIPSSAQVGAPFCLSLEAEGGDGSYSWTVVEGLLPPGLELVPGADAVPATLCGRPTTVGFYDFTLEVASGSGSDRLTARSRQTIQTIRGVADLAIAATHLPMARFQVPYESGLMAFGGTVPYRWSATGDGALPAGLSLQEDGLVFGTPLEAGSFWLQVQVADTAGQIRTARVTLEVASPPRITCSSRTFGTLALGEPFTGKLLAAGGSSGKYKWTSVDTTRYDDPGALDLADPAGPPPGLELDELGGVSGAPNQVGRYIWTVEVQDDERSDEWDSCAIALDVVGGHDLTVTTGVLPDAVPEREYRAQLAASGGAGTLTWSLASDSSLPEGMSLDRTGVLGGVPTTSALDGKTSRTFGFLVEVRDGRNLKGMTSFSLTLALEKEGNVDLIERDEGGCRTAGGGSGLAALVLVLVALRRRR